MADAWLMPILAALPQFMNRYSVQGPRCLPFETSCPANSCATRARLLLLPYYTVVHYTTNAEK